MFFKQINILFEHLAVDYNKILCYTSICKLNYRDDNMLEKTYLEFLAFMCHEPKFKNWKIKNRRTSSIMTVEKGTFIYEFQGKEFELKSGESIFLPYLSSYSYKITTNHCICHQVMFNIFDAEGTLKLSDNPKKTSDAKVGELIKKIVVQGNSPNQLSPFKFTADFYTVLSMFFEKTIDRREVLRIFPALKYIEEHYAENINLDNLAELCMLSQSQLRRLFKAETLMSPIEYKNSLRIKAALSMLIYSEKNISEISQELGFANPYIFSRTFKEWEGVSPTEFRKTHIQ